MFQTVLIANRGEIACRITATLRALGIRSVAVFTADDAGARHVTLADEAVRIGSYLSITEVTDAALRTGADAIHPGYGFLAENAAFARACAETGIVFVGPGVDAIATMGDKIAAKAAVEARGVPTVPGVARPGMTDAELAAEADAVGYPLLVKPSAGGGGKGMHVVTARGELDAALAAARREAGASFGDDTLFLERYISSPRHIEVQVLADAHGRVIHLGERECSLQRRHQKVIEEAPSPLLDEATRDRIGAAACETARSVGYVGAGTVEFIVSADAPEDFFFMEMNTRLQVEHPVTEEITGIDLVAAQLHIAAEEPLGLAQDDVVLRGHSIEARVYAEDPREGFLPTGGRVLAVRHPRGVRVDTALADGLDVSAAYDPMLAKVIARGATREEARGRLLTALDDTAVFGFPTNVEFLRLLLGLPDVVRGDLDTGLIARSLDDLPWVVPTGRDAVEAALLLEASTPRGDGAWARGDGWRLGPAAPRRYALTAGDEVFEVSLGGAPGHPSVDGQPASARIDGTLAIVEVDGAVRRFPALVRDGVVHLVRDGAVLVFAEARPQRAGTGEAAEDPRLLAPMPGTVVLRRVADGARVEVGDAVVVIEAMKMEHVVRAAAAGTVRFAVAEGDTVARGELVASVEGDPE